MDGDSLQTRVDTPHPRLLLRKVRAKANLERIQPSRGMSSIGVIVVEGWSQTVQED